MQLKIDKKFNLKTNYSFEAPIIKTSEFLGDVGKLSAEIKTFNLSSYLLSNPKQSYLVRVVGDSMIEKGILEGDLLVVTKSKIANDGDIVIAALNSELAVKTYRFIDGKAYLFSANKRFLPIEIKPFWEFQIQGIVKFVIHNL